MTNVAPPFTLSCKWCPFSIRVHARGGHGRSQGNGYDAATLMEEHITAAHGKTWRVYLTSNDNPETPA